MKNLNVLITGASSGIGYALATVFAQHNYNLVLVARRKDKLDEVAETLSKKYGIKTTAIAHDLCSHHAAKDLYTKLGERNIPIDILVNNAGRGHYGEFIGLDVDMEEDTIALNITALTSLCKLFAKPMAEKGQGHIINIASIAAFLPGPGMAVYNASKAYVLSLSEALHEEYKPYGIGVTASCPGLTESEFFTLAGTDKLSNLKYGKFMTANAVAKEIYSAMKKKKSVVVHGVSNKFVTMLPRTLPRSWVSKTVKSLMK